MLCASLSSSSTLSLSSAKWSFAAPRHFSSNPPLHAVCSFLFALVFYALTNPHGYLTLPAAATDLGAHFLHVHDAKWIIITLCIAVNTGANLIGIGASTPAAAPKAVSSSIVSVTASQPKAVAPAESSSSAPVKAAKETPKPLDEDEDDSADAPVPVSKAGKRASSGRKTK